MTDLGNALADAAARQIARIIVGVGLVALVVGVLVGRCWL